MCGEHQVHGRYVRVRCDDVRQRMLRGSDVCDERGDAVRQWVHKLHSESDDRHVCEQYLQLRGQRCSVCGGACVLRRDVLQHDDGERVGVGNVRVRDRLCASVHGQ